MLLLYHTLIKSHINYCITSWCIGNKTSVDKIQRQANQFIRLIFGLKKNESIKSIANHHKLSSVEQTCYLQAALFMHKHKIKLLPVAFDHFFLIRSANGNADSRITRSSSEFLPKFCRIDVTKQSMLHKGPLAWDQVPNILKHKKLSSKSFYLQLTTFIMNIPNDFLL